ncbi:DUF7507 domain-containing protein [Paractinoplanes lichenicola]|uniref:DUF11 domain-containing protein n=1 Tax=Paractinoplanes lichenicola TaxID=2802976 RepID=A0ABS1W1A9_9ACTN|nr:isopeptide-forming domain-containing fimbrial protein [Actinoplanes lichenicola]MBL7260522.1 DUF11 domain-containing protein [Actinoplanes lichenicola]
MSFAQRVRPWRGLMARVAAVAVLTGTCLLLPVTLPGLGPVATAATVCPAAVSLVNGDFESPSIAAASMSLIPETNMPGWKTTAPDKVFELWRQVRMGVDAGSREQFVELNANYVSTLYQDVATTPGQVLRWQLKHRGRLGTDVMAVNIGPAGGVQVRQRTISDGQTWGTYGGNYTVPAGQTNTRFAFESVSAAQNMATHGNFLDGISFGTSPCLATTTAVSQATANVGDVLTYTVTARNDGGNPAQLSVLSDDLPAGLTFVPGSIRSINGSVTTTVSDASDSDTGEYTAATRTVNVRAGVGAGAAGGGTIPVGESRSFSYQARVTSAVAASTISDDATATYTDDLAATRVTSTSNVVTTAVAAAADLAVAGTVASPGVVAGRRATTNLTVTNAGPSTAAATQVTATAPAGITNVTATSPQGPCTVTGSTAVCDVGPLPVSGTATVTVSGDVPAAATPGAQATLTASVASGTYELNQADNATSVSATVATSADLGVTLTYAPTTPVAGGTVTYTATVTNAGPSTARTIALTDPIATGSTFVSATTPGGSCSLSSTRTVECSLPDLNPGGTQQVSIVVQLDSGGSGAINNAVSISSATSDPVVGNNNMSVQSSGTSVADVGVKLSLGASSAYPGDTVPFTLVVTNNGPSAATNVSFNTVVPPGITIVRPSNPYCSASACTFPGLAAGQVVTITGSTVVGPDVAAGVHQASTTVISPTTDNNAANDTDTVTFTILLRADLAVTQALTGPGGSTTLVAGRDVRGVVTVTNNGPTRADGVSLRQPVPAGRPVPSASSSGGGSCAYQGGLYLCTISSLAASATWTITFDDVPLPPAYAGDSFARTASVSSSAPDPDSSNDSVTTTATVEHRADLRVTMTTSTPAVVQTGPVAFRATVENLGPSDASSVVVREDLSAGLVLTSGTPTSGAYDPTGRTWTLGALAVAATERLDLTGEAQGSGALTATTRVVSSASTDPAPGNDSDAVTVTAAAAAPALNLEVTTAVAPGSATAAGAGDTITYTYRVTNTGNLPMSGLVVTGSRGGPGACGATTLAVGAATTCPAGGYQVTSADVTAGQPILDVVTADAENSATTGPVQYAKVTAGVPLAAAHPSLVVMVTPTVSAPSRQNAAAAGDRIDYSYEIVNNGNVAMEFIGLTDTRAAGVGCPATTLAIGATMTCTSAAGYTVTQADLDAGGVITDAVTVNARPAGSPTAITFGPFGVDVTVAAPAPALLLKVTADRSGPVAAGDVIAYEYEVTNTGNVTVDHLDVTDELIDVIDCPALTLAVGATMTCTSDGGYLVTQDDIDAGVPVEDDALVTAQGVAPGSPVVQAESYDPVPVVAAAPGLALTITPTGRTTELTLGDRISYAYTVRNTGNVTMRAVAVTDSRFGAASCPATVVAVGATMACTAGAIYTVTQTDVDTGGSVALTARVLSGGTVRDTATSILPLASARGALTITVSPVAGAVVGAGDTIGYTYRITNVGRVTMRDIAVDDDTLGAATCPVTSLAPAASTTCTSSRTYTVTDQDVDAGEALTTEAYVSGKLPGGATVTFGPATAAVPVLVPAPALTAQGFAVVTPATRQYAARPGDTVAYTFEVANTGNRALTGIAVTALRSGTARCPATTLAVRATMTCTGQRAVAVTQADQDAAAPFVESVRVLAGTLEFGPFTVAVQLEKPVFMLRIMAIATHRPAVTAGDSVSVAYRVTNTGNVSASGLSVPSAACPVAALAPAAVVTCPMPVPYTVTQADIDRNKPLTFRSSATATWSGRASTFGPAAATIALAAPRPAVTAVQTATWKDRDGNGVLGVADDVVSTFEVTNTGNVTLVNVRVTGFPAAVTCKPTRLAPGASATCVSVVYHLTARDIANGERTTEATVTGDVESLGRPTRAAAPSTVVIPFEPPPGEVPVTGPAAGRLALAGLAVIALGIALMMLVTVAPGGGPARTPVQLVLDGAGRWRPAGPGRHRAAG